MMTTGTQFNGLSEAVAPSADVLCLDGIACANKVSASEQVLCQFQESCGLTAHSLSLPQKPRFDVISAFETGLFVFTSESPLFFA